MKSKPSILTIVLILVSLYLCYLTIVEYRATAVSLDFYEEQFEKSLEDIGISEDISGMTLEELEDAQMEDRIERIENDVTNNWNMELYIGWLIRARIHLQMAILSILLTIVSWRFDLLNNAKKK